MNRKFINLFVKIIIIVLFVSGVFIYGIGVGKYSWPPHDTVRSTYRNVALVIDNIRTERVKKIRIYVIADAHVGDREKAELLNKFSDMCNTKKPDLVLDLGDCISGEITELYDYPTDRKAALSQKQDWLSAWNSIEDEIIKIVALGNRDIISERDPRGLDEDLWIKVLEYDDRDLSGGTKLQTAFEVENHGIKGLVIILSTYSPNWDRDSTVVWIRDQIIEFDGDFILFANHSIHIYEDIRDLIEEYNIEVPSLFLHGHNHGTDTLTRDAWGYELNDLHFPSYLLVNFFGTGIGAKFEIYKDGTYKTYRIDVINQEISLPYLHYQTRIKN